MKAEKQFARGRPDIHLLKINIAHTFNLPIGITREYLCIFQSDLHTGITIIDMKGRYMNYMFAKNATDAHITNNKLVYQRYDCMQSHITTHSTPLPRAHPTKDDPPILAMRSAYAACFVACPALGGSLYICNNDAYAIRDDTAYPIGRAEFPHLMSRILANEQMIFLFKNSNIRIVYPRYTISEPVIRFTAKRACPSSRGSDHVSDSSCQLICGAVISGNFKSLLCVNPTECQYVVNTTQETVHIFDVTRSSCPIRELYHAAKCQSVFLDSNLLILCAIREKKTILTGIDVRAAIPAYRFTTPSTVHNICASEYDGAMSALCIGCSDSTSWLVE